MSKIQTPCVVCNDIIYVSVNMGPEAAVCVSCKRQGKAPKKERIGRCSKCKIKLTEDRISPRPEFCLFCYGRMIKVEQEQEARAKDITPAAVCEANDDMPVTDTFGGFPWLHANVCPVG